MGIYKTDAEGNYDIRDASQRVRYYALKNGEQTHIFTTPDEAGTYKAVLWTTGYTVLDEIDLTVAAPTLTASVTKLNPGNSTTLTASVSATASAPLWMGIYVLDANGEYSIADASQRFAYAEIAEGSNAATVTLDSGATAGTYKAVVWTTGWTVLAETELTVTVLAGDNDEDGNNPSWDVEPEL